jgi:hypothetical protein
LLHEERVLTLINLTLRNSPPQLANTKQELADTKAIRTTPDRDSGLAKVSDAATSKIAKMSSRIARLNKNSAADQAEIARMASRVAKYRQELAKARQSLRLIWQKKNTTHAQHD